MKVPNSEKARQLLSNKRSLKALYSALSNPETPIPFKGGNVYLSRVPESLNIEKSKSRPK